MNTKKEKILLITGLFIACACILGFSVNFVEAKDKKVDAGGGSKESIKACPWNQVCESKGDCPNGNFNGVHYSNVNDIPCEAKGTCGGGSGNTVQQDPPIQGICGGFNGGFNPRNGLYGSSGGCASGDYGGGNWNGSNGVAGVSFIWSCNGSNGGGNSTCYFTPPPAAGSCGLSNGKITTKQPAVWDYMCSSGPESFTGLFENTYKWLCQGTYGGSNASCQAEALPQVGKCGDYFSQDSTALVEELPSDNAILCKRGLAKNISSSTTDFSWSCAGVGGAISSGVCKATKVSDGQTATVFSTSTPVKTLTVTGRITPNIVNKGQYCSLSDLEYTTNKGADDSYVICGVERNRVPYPDKSLTTTNYQVEPGYEYVFKCQDYSPTGIRATGETKPLKCVLNPTILER